MDSIGGYFEKEFTRMASIATIPPFPQMIIPSRDVQQHHTEYSYAMKERRISDQIRMLSVRFPYLNVNSGLCDIPPEARPPRGFAWYAIPYWSACGATYAEATRRMVAAFFSVSDHDAYRTRAAVFAPAMTCDSESGAALCDMLSDRYLREGERKASMMKRLRNFQESDLVVVSAQFGIRHKGRSADRTIARLGANEFGLGVFEVAAMLLTHPERLTRSHQLQVICPGDEYAPEGDGVFSRVPSFSVRTFGEGDLRRKDIEYGTVWRDTATEDRGPVTAVIPPELLR